VDKIGLDGTVIKHTVGENTEKIQGPIADHATAMNKVVGILTAAGGPVKNVADVKVVGHRVVHGGQKYGEPTIINDETMAGIEACIPLAPLHNPANLLGIKTAQAVFKVPQVAVFDTAFHATMPPESFRYAVPKELYEKHAVRRYGFHGTSYKFVTAETARLMGQHLEDLNMIVCHLGNGASMACVKKGKVVDTTMGLTPLEGLVMGTRSGDIDPGLYTFLCDHLKMSAQEVDALLNKKSGLLGLSGKSDMREVIAAAAKGEPDSVLTRKVYVERIRKYIGSFLVKLNGDLDALVFTAGVGEGDRLLWQLATAGLQPMGIDVDPEKIKAYDGEGGEIQSAFSRAKVMIVPTQEELCIAEQALEIVGLRSATKSAAAPSAVDLRASITDPNAVVSPKKFMHNLREFARSTKQRIVLPEGHDPRIVAAAGELLAEGLVNLIILGKPNEIRKHAKDAGVSVEAADIVDTSTANIDKMVKALVDARKVTPEKATEMVRGDLNWFGTMMMYLDQADGMVSGAAHATADTMRPALTIIKAAPGVSQVSSYFFMLFDRGCTLYSDSGLVINPTAEELAGIAKKTAESARDFGIAPRIALLSYVTGADSHEATKKSREATEILKKMAPNELVEGPIQYDAAVNPAIAEQKFKGKNSPVAGKASVCIFPDLNAGNIGYKIGQQSSGCVAIGPITQGLRKPVNDLSRGCTIEDVKAAILVTCGQSIAGKKAAGGAPMSKL
jgi:acetate kinase